MEQRETIILDNGGYTMKIGTSRDIEPRVVPNCIVKAKADRKREFVADEQAECMDKTGLFYVLPFERGYLLHPEVEEQIWERVFDSYSTKDSRIVMTDPNYLIFATEDVSVEVLLEQHCFHSVYKASAAGFIALEGFCRNIRPVLVVDCGFSCITVAPFLDGKAIQQGLVRIDVGGKVLTNQLKEWITYRHLNVIEETYIMNQCKEDVCFVSSNFNGDMKTARYRDARNTICREYVLPDFCRVFRGYMREPSRSGKLAQGEDAPQAIVVNRERFTLTEILFQPSLIGLKQIGVVEAVVESLSRCPMDLRAALVQNISLVGGCTLFPGFRERFITELRLHMDASWCVALADVSNPVTHAWSCASAAFSGDLADQDQLFVTREEWNEHGEDILYKKFSNFLDFESEPRDDASDEGSA